MKINKQSSRDANLYVFSHEHHHALIFSVRLKKAQNTIPETLKRYVLHFWDRYLNSHFTNEEALLLPHLSDEELKKRFLNEHVQIKNIVNEIVNGKGGIYEKAGHLSNLIRQHVKFEERELFPWIQEHLSEKDLRKIGEGLAHISITADDFSPKFWE